MFRLDELRKHVTLSDLGVEIAPYFNPIVPKAAGYNVLIVDVFDTETLRSKAKDDPLIPQSRLHEIEPVDIVADASQLFDALEARALNGKIGFIVSSHNFEHLPNPIKFLQACSKALVPGGFLSMALPDYRACFDHFRMPTRLADWLAAYHHDVSQPSPEIRFDALANHARYTSGVAPLGCNIAKDDPNGFQLGQNLRTAYEAYLADLKDPGSYKDTHCSIVFPDSFELLLSDLEHLEVVDLSVVEITQTFGLEFFVHLQKPMRAGAQLDEGVFYARREELSRRVNSVLGAAGFGMSKRHDTSPSINKRVSGVTSQKLDRRLAAFFASLFGEAQYGRLRQWNRRRRARTKVKRTA